MPAPNMTLNIELGVSGTQQADDSWQLFVTYRQLDTSMPNSFGACRTNGNIDLGLMYGGDQFSKATDISFILSNVQITDKSGNLLTVYFASPRSSAVTFTGTDAATEFNDFEDDGSGNVLVFTDLDSEQGQYDYCLMLNGFTSTAPNGPAIPIPLDPKIVNPG